MREQHNQSNRDRGRRSRNQPQEGHSVGSERGSNQGSWRESNPSRGEHLGSRGRDYDYESEQSYQGDHGRWEPLRSEAPGRYWGSDDEYDYERNSIWEEDERRARRASGNYGGTAGLGGNAGSYGGGSGYGGYRGSYAGESPGWQSQGWRSGSHGAAHGLHGGYSGYGSGVGGHAGYRSSRNFASPAETYGGEAGASERYGSHAQRGRAPKGYTRSDERIREDVCDRLVEANLDAGEMEIEVHDGEVELKGGAPSRDVKHRAERIAASVLGVKDVTNHLRIQRESQSERQSQR